jgi:hypothetical protein
MISLTSHWDFCRHYRDLAKTELRRQGFTPTEDIIDSRNWETDPAIKVLQWEWRKPNCDRDPSEILWAVIDALTQEGIAVWPGDATSCVEQIVRVQYDRAEALLAENEALRKKLADAGLS